MNLRKNYGGRRKGRGPGGTSFSSPNHGKLLCLPQVSSRIFVAPTVVRPELVRKESTISSATSEALMHSSRKVLEPHKRTFLRWFNLKSSAQAEPCKCLARTFSAITP